MKRTRIVLGCLFLLLAPAAASLATETGVCKAPLMAESLPQHDAGAAQQADFPTWLAQHEIPAQPAAAHGGTVGACSATFCQRCAGICCTTPTGGCLCCPD